MFDVYSDSTKELLNILTEHYDDRKNTLKKLQEESKKLRGHSARMALEVDVAKSDLNSIIERIRLHGGSNALKEIKNRYRGENNESVKETF